jgi:hypothetical protein
MVELLYATHNRLEFTRATFEALLDNTDWSLVEHLHVCDDRSRDGTYDFLNQAIRLVPVPVSLTSSDFGGPVAAMLHTVARCKAGVLAKVDNDLVVCPGWLQALLSVLESSGLDVLGFEPGFGAPVAPVEAARSFLPARHVGGVGLFRTRIFQRAKLRQHGRWFGLTDFQRHHADCGWITPDLPCFLLDHLDLEPWRSLAEVYVSQGWSRAWPKYDPEMSAYWSWWVQERAAVA